MATLSAVDRIVIHAERERVFSTVLDYPAMHTWFPDYRCMLLSGTEVVEGARVAHRVVAPIVRVPTEFVRTVQRIERPRRIEETYDSGDLVGAGRWEFESLGERSGVQVSFSCHVRSNRAWLHLGFAIAGEFGHKLTYRRLLGALKLHCER